MEYSDWAYSEPNNGFNQTEDCLQLYPSSSSVDSDRRWNDLSCRKITGNENYKNKPLCQLF